MTASFPSLTQPNRSRPWLLALMAQTLSDDNPKIRKDNVNEHTSIVPSQIAIFEMRLRHFQLLKDDEQLRIEATVGEIIEQVAQ